MSQKEAHAVLLVADRFCLCPLFCSLMKDLDLHYQGTQDNLLSQSISRSKLSVI